jgi:hypothetical protein
MQFSSATLPITGSETVSGAATITGNMTASNVFAATGNWIGWGDFTDRIQASNSGSMFFVTSSNTRLTITGAGDATFAQTLTSTGAFTGSSTAHVVGAATLDSTLNVAGATTLSSTAHLVGAGTFDSTLAVADNIAGAARVKFAVALYDSGATFTVGGCGSSPVLSGGSTNGTVTTGSGATGCGITFGGGVTYTTNASCWVSTESSTKTFAYSTNATSIAITGAAAGQTFHFGCVDHH